MIYAVYFLDGNNRPIMVAAFMGHPDAEDFLETLGESYYLAEVDKWDSWADIRDAIPKPQS